MTPLTQDMPLVTQHIPSVLPVHPWRTGLRCPVMVLTLLLPFVTSCHHSIPGNASRPDHVVVVVVDTLRADHLPLYGYARNTAPFLSRLGAEGVVFEHAVSTSTYTAEAISSLFSGYYPSATSWGTGWHARPALDRPTLAMRFQDAGYKTALFSESPMLDHPEYQRGFDDSTCLSAFGVSGQAPSLVAQALAWLEDHADQPTFLYLHILDPHSPYAPPPEQYNTFVTDRPARPVEMEEDLRTRLGALKTEGFGPGESRFENVIQRYDAEIAFVDHAIASFFDGLERLGMRDKTLAVVTADHGEEFLEHGYVEHAWKLYPETFHIPMIVWRPGRIIPARVAQTVSLVDLTPTLLHLQGIETSDVLSGTTFFRSNGDGTRPEISGAPRMLELLIQSRCLIRGIIQDDQLYLAYWKWLSPEDCERTANLPRENRMGFFDGTEHVTDPWGPIIREEYYDLKADPACQHNLAPTQPDALARGRAQIETYRSTCPPQLPDRFKATKEPQVLTPEQSGLLKGIDPALLAPPPNGQPDEEMLRTLGYL